MKNENISKELMQTFEILLPKGKVIGDRFYEQQKKFKPKRVFKKDIILEINTALGTEVQGLEACTIKTLNSLVEAIDECKNTIR